METRLLNVFQSVFGDDVAALQDSDAIDSLPGWDSAGHLNLIMAIEAEFGVQFDIEEMESLTDVASIRKRLDRA
jgi:acyl carrier protein